MDARGTAVKNAPLLEVKNPGGWKNQPELRGIPKTAPVGTFSFSRLRYVGNAGSPATLPGIFD